MKQIRKLANKKQVVFDVVKPIKMMFQDDKIDMTKIRYDIDMDFKGKKATIIFFKIRED